MEWMVLRREGRRTGAAVLSAPWLVVAAIAAFAAVSAISGYGAAKADRQLGGGLELVLPLAVSVVAVFAALADPCLELQLSLPTSYRRTVCRRTLLAVAPALVLGPAGTVYLRWTGHPVAGRDLLTAQLVWFAPALWLTAAALLVGVVVRSAAAAAAAVAAVWLGEQFLHQVMLDDHWARQMFLFTTVYAPGSPTWPSNRAWLLVTALAAAAVAARLLRRPDRLLRGDD